MANLVAGQSLIYRRAFRVGDRVTIADVTGDVEGLSAQATFIRTSKNERVTIPNAIVLSSQVTNYSHFARDQGLIMSPTRRPRSTAGVRRHVTETSVGQADRLGRGLGPPPPAEGRESGQGGRPGAPGAPGPVTGPECRPAGLLGPEGSSRTRTREPGNDRRSSHGRAEVNRQAGVRAKSSGGALAEILAEAQQVAVGVGDDELALAELDGVAAVPFLLRFEQQGDAVPARARRGAARGRRRGSAG